MMELAIDLGTAIAGFVIVLVILTTPTRGTRRW